MNIYIYIYILDTFLRSNGWIIFVSFYTLLFTLEINVIEQILEHFVPVFKNSYFQFFSCNFQNFVYISLKKKLKFGSIKIEDKVFPCTLNVIWWKSVGKQFRNSALNVTGCEKNEVGEKRSYKGELRSKKLADVPYIFYQLKMKP